MDEPIVKISTSKKLQITLGKKDKEIERLRQSFVGAVQNAECQEKKLEREIERLKRVIDNKVEIQILEAERDHADINRLKKALEEIVDDTETRDEMIQIAVEVLKEE